ncbi:MAG: CDP-alcohol phosphatidyltransferase family protein [Bacteroidales bacterium]|nr:CDP-alcohol phosphatidyltransferase family protein [Bacteroidales bacterium]
MLIKRLISHIPNTLTSINLIGGCLAILIAFSGDLRLSAIILLVAFHADIFDGMSARLLKVQSLMGKELDSLADLVSFGLAPAVILHVMLKQQLNIEAFAFSLPTETWITLLTPFTLPVFAALRLAKFNVDENQKDEFIGLPTPANALMVISLPLIAFSQPDSFIINLFSNPATIIIYSIAVSLLMVAPVHLYGLKLKGFGWQINKFRYLFLAIGIVTIMTFYHTGLFLTIVLYFGYGVLFGILKRKGIIS